MATVYIETTIPSYLTAWPSRDVVIAGHQQVTRDWWRQRRQRFELFVSQLVIDEASEGDATAAEARLECLAGIPMLEVTEVVDELAGLILSADAMPAKAALDAAHVALAAIHRIDFLLTWNCRHIANAELIPLVQRVCLSNGHRFPTICTPDELMGDA